MLKKTEREYRDYLLRIITKWVPRLHLQGFLIGIEKDSKEKFLACRYRFPYKDAQILFTDASFKKWLVDPNQEHEVVHELCHIITDPFYTKATDRYVTKGDMEDERERLTDTIAILAIKNND